MTYDITEPLDKLPEKYSCSFAVVDVEDEGALSALAGVKSCSALVDEFEVP